MPDFKLSAEQTAQLHAVGTTLSDIEAVIKKGEAAGLDMSEQRARLEYAKTIRAGVLQQFGAGVFPQQSNG